jgi:hypothetical protein
MPWTLSSEIPAGKAAKFYLHERHEIIERRTVPFTPGGEEFRDLGSRRWRFRRR